MLDKIFNQEICRWRSGATAAGIGLGFSLLLTRCTVRPLIEMTGFSRLFEDIRYTIDLDLAIQCQPSTINGHAGFI